MKRWKDCVAVVTGAGSGIGAAIVKELIKSKMYVAALDKNVESCRKNRKNLKDEKLIERYHAIECDVGDVDSIEEAFDRIEEDLFGVDVLVNNAGVLYPGMLVTQKASELDCTLQTNIMGAVHCTQRAFHSMMKRKCDGHVVLINSIFGHNVFAPILDLPPALNIYPMTKHGITAMAEVLRQEFRDNCTRIKVTSVSPGFVRNDLVLKKCKRLGLLSPRDVAKAVKYVIATPPHVQVHELTIKAVGEIV